MNRNGPILIKVALEALLQPELYDLGLIQVCRSTDSIAASIATVFRLPLIHPLHPGPRCCIGVDILLERQPYSFRLPPCPRFQGFHTDPELILTVGSGRDIANFGHRGVVDDLPTNFDTAAYEDGRGRPVVSRNVGNCVEIGVVRK